MTSKRCGQCGKSYSERACGPSHALVAAERKAIAAVTSRLKGRIKRVAWRIPADHRRSALLDIAACSDEWAEVERRKGPLTAALKEEPHGDR